jgi:hypothetical protein
MSEPSEWDAASFRSFRINSDPTPGRFFWTPVDMELHPSNEGREERRGFFFPFHLPGDSPDSTPRVITRPSSYLKEADATGKKKKGAASIIDAALEKTTDLLRILEHALERKVGEADDLLVIDCGCDGIQDYFGDGASTTCSERSRLMTPLSLDSSTFADQDGGPRCFTWSAV